MKSILRVLSGEALTPSPVWLMRQAGRYLPEYRAIREQAGSFLNLVYNPVQAADVTLQPLRRFDFDAAILFSDILVVPHGMGIDLKFEAGEGPRLSPVQTTADLEKLKIEDKNYWPRVFETVSTTRSLMDRHGFENKTLIGFAGGPWTVACYVVQGTAHDRDFEMVRARAFADPLFFDTLIDKITRATIFYLIGQIRAGADVIQIFDSWAGVAGGALFDRYVIAPMQKIIATIRKEFPHTPVIGFPRGAGNRLSAYVAVTKVHAVGCDYTCDLKQVRTDLGPTFPLQGNLDPLALLAGGAALRTETNRVLKAVRGTPHIFNLGHGILPTTPIAHVEQLIKHIREQQ